MAQNTNTTPMSIIDAFDGGYITLAEMVTELNKLAHEEFGREAVDPEPEDVEDTEDEDLVECEHCGQLVRKGDLVDVETYYGTEQWCHECADEYAEKCQHCGDLHPRDEMRDVCVRDAYYWESREYESWCDGCVESDAVTCEDCDELFAEDAVEVREMWNGYEQVICARCIDEYYECDDCGRWCHRDEIECPDDWGDHYYCPDCIGRHRSPIRGYSHTYASSFWIRNGLRKYDYQLNEQERKLPYMGVELEVDGFDDRLSSAIEIKDAWDDEHVVLKHDGSLDEGFEIVSQPMTIDTHLGLGMWEDIVTKVRDYGGISHDAGTCGLHIHLSKASFVSPDAIYRLDRLFHRFRTEMVRFARRTEGQMRWCEIGDDSDIAAEPDITLRKEKWEAKKDWRGRYEAVNVKNSATVEIRLWRGTLNIETLFATFQMTYGLWHVANTITDEFVERLTWSGLKMLVRFALLEHGLGYDEFDAYIERRGL